MRRQRRRCRSSVGYTRRGRGRPPPLAAPQCGLAAAVTCLGRQRGQTVQYQWVPRFKGEPSLQGPAFRRGVIAALGEPGARRRADRPLPAVASQALEGPGGPHRAGRRRGPSRARRARPVRPTVGSRNASARPQPGQAAWSEWRPAPARARPVPPSGRAVRRYPGPAESSRMEGFPVPSPRGRGARGRGRVPRRSRRGAAARRPRIAPAIRYNWSSLLRTSFRPGPPRASAGGSSRSSAVRQRPCLSSPSAANAAESGPNSPPSGTRANAANASSRRPTPQRQLPSQ